MWFERYDINEMSILCQYINIWFQILYLNNICYTSINYPNLQPIHKIQWTTVLSAHTNFQPINLGVKGVLLIQVASFIEDVPKSNKTLIQTRSFWSRGIFLFSNLSIHISKNYMIIQADFVIENLLAICWKGIKSHQQP